MVSEFTKKEFLNIASEIVGVTYEVDDTNKTILNILYDYVKKNDKRLEQFDDFSINKGFFFYGVPGVGKTDLFLILQRILALHKDERVFNKSIACKIANQFAKEGFEVFAQFKGKNWFFDDLGIVQRETAVHFGNKVNVSELLIMDRYDLFRSRGIITHFTSNHSIQSLEKIYDERVISRLREMCNFYHVQGTDRRATKRPKEFVIEREKELTESDKKDLFLKVLNEDLFTPYKLYLTNEKHTVKDEYNIMYNRLLTQGLIVEDEAYNILLQKHIANLRTMKPLSVQEAVELKEFRLETCTQNNPIMQKAIYRAKNDYFQQIMAHFKAENIDLEQVFLSKINHK